MDLEPNLAENDFGSLLDSNLRNNFTNNLGFVKLKHVVEGHGPEPFMDDTRNVIPLNSILNNLRGDVGINSKSENLVHLNVVVSV